MSVSQFPKKGMGESRVIHTNSNLHERLTILPYKSEGKIYVNVTAEADSQQATVIGVPIEHLRAALKDIV